MSRTVVCFYDHEAPTFVSDQAARRGWWLRAGATTALSLAIGAAGVGIVSQAVSSPAEVAEQSEIGALRGQLDHANTHLARVSTELASLAETDREIYRTVLHADTVSEDRFSTPTRELLTETTATLDRQTALQRDAELGTADGRREAALRQQPAILPLRDARMTSGYGMRFHPVLHVTRLHAGVDFGAASGTPVYATGDGIVSFVGTRGGYGNVVEIDHPLAGRMTRYAHLTSAAPGIRVGTAVRRGQTVALSGHSGLSTAPHLHYEVRQLNMARTPTNPVETFLPSVTPAEYRELLATSRSGTASFD